MLTQVTHNCRTGRDFHTLLDKQCTMYLDIFKFQPILKINEPAPPPKKKEGIQDL